MKNLYNLMSLCFISLFGMAQNTPEISSVVTPEVTVCGAAEVYQVRLDNPSNGSTISGVSFTVTLPQGMEYVSGSLTESTNSNVAEQNVSNLNAVVFSASNLAAGDSIVFDIQIEANTQAIIYQQQGNVFRNSIQLSHSAGQVSHTSNAYNVLYAALSIINVSPTSQTVISGNTTTRSITIVNAGNGKLSTFSISDVTNKVGLDLISTNLGTLNASNDVITLASSDFATIGNQDGYFNKNEQITIIQTLTVSGCASTTVSSAIKTSWGCDSGVRESNTSYAHVSISLKNPSLSISSTNSLSSCFSTQNSAQQITLKNTGQGFATEVEVDIYKSSGGAYDQDLFSAIDASSLTYQIGTNGTPVSVTPTTYATRNDGAYSCLGNNPIGRVVLQLPIDIAPNQTIIIKWNTNHCCVNECNNEDLMGWKYKVSYEDICGNNTYSSTKTGEGTTELNMTVFTETPIDINAGQVLPFVYTISSHDNNLPVGSGAKYEVILDLPLGLNWAGGANDLVWTSSPTNWTPSSVSFNANTRKLTGIFLVPEPFNIQKSEIVANLVGDCSVATSGYKTIGLDINYIPDESCASCKVAMVCNKTTSTNLHCPISNCEGVHFLSFSATRTNYGSPDNNTNGLADNTGSLDFSKVKTKRVMVGDTLQTQYKVVVETGTNQSQFYNFFVEANIDYGQHLSVLDGEISIYENSSGATYSCTNFQVDEVNSGSNQRKFRYAFLPNYDCLSLPNTLGGGGNFYFTDGDSITFTVNYKVTGNIGGNVEEVTVNNDLFTSAFSDPWGSDAAQLHTDKWACDDYDGRFTLIGYYFDNSWANNVTVKSCTRVVQQNFWLSIGDCCDNYSGGNLFPYEYRNWAHIKEVRVSIPTDYEVVSVRFNQRRTRTTNVSSTETINSISPYHNSGGNMYFNLEQHYSEFGGTLNYSDDGFYGTVYLELAPTCDVPINTYQDINWEFQFKKNDIIGGGVTSWLTSSPDRIRYKPTTLSLSSTNPIVDGLGRTVAWNLSVSNTTSNSSAANSWVHIKSPSGGVEILAFLDAETGDTLQLTSDYYALGTVNTNSSKSYTIIGKYSGCAPDYITVYSGYECSGYPVDFAHFYCSYSTYGLQVEPKNAEPQVTIAGTTIGSDCSNTIEVTIEVASVKFAHLDSIEVDISAVGNSMTFIDGSGLLKYPLSSSFGSISNPVANGGVKTYKLMQVNSALNENGLPGVLDLSNNRFQLRFQMNLESDFVSGHYVQLSIKSKEICGTPLPIINVAYDPSVQFNENSIAGLSNDASNSWGIAWGDYDNDGFDDIYVSEYEENKGSFLYHNNQDGTFTKESTGIVVSDLGSSIAGTWGDYNNDGHLDLFVANNTKAVNALYKNLGGGSFSRVTTGDIANYGGYCHGASWVDYNNDGYLDLFVTDYMPTKFNVLYKNNGDETFTSVTNSTIVQEAKYSIGATWADYDNDGDMDVFVPATQGQSNSLFRNNGAEVFEKMTTVGISTDNANSVGCSWGDYDNDGDLDLFVTNTSGQNNFLYRNNGNGTFTQITNGIVVNDGGHSSSSNWIDFDNDGDMDLYVCNDQADKNALYINDGNGNFTKPETPLSSDLGNSYSQAWSDFDNDGDMDVLVGNHSNETNVFFENSRASCNSWFCLKLTGVNSNRSAIGARVKVKATINGVSTWQLKEVSAQTGGGAGSQNSLKLLFGLGNASSIDSVVIQWPSGYQQVLTNQSINDCMDVTEGNGIQICGTAYHDENSNCVKDADESGIPGVLIRVEPGNRGVTTDNNGNYQVFVEPGEYTVNQESIDNWTLTCGTDGHSFTATEGNTYCNNNFGNDVQCPDPDLGVTIGTTVLRKGFRNNYSVIYSNTGGADAYNVELIVEFSNKIQPLSASLPWGSVFQDINTTTYTWVIDTVKAMTYYDFVIEDSVSVAVTLGETLTVSANITDFGNDCSAGNNTYVDVNTVVGAVDPNDISVYPTGDGPEGYVVKTQELRYKIRFQNVGTYYAQNVKVINELPQSLDVNTIKNVHSSHSYKLKQNGQQIEFIYDNIYLPDSCQNQEGSNGFVEFTIQPRYAISSGEMIQNDAEIFFDYEDPLLTNRVVNTIKYDSYINNSVLIQPNPAKDQTKVYLELSKDMYSNADNIDRMEVYDAVGKQVSKFSYTTQEQDIYLDCSLLNKGCYMLKVYNQRGELFVGKLIKE